MMDRLKVHARDLFNHHDKNDNGVLDKEESKVRQYCRIYTRVYAMHDTAT